MYGAFAWARRALNGRNGDFRPGQHAGEDLGVDVLSHSPSFRLPMPVVDKLTLDEHSPSLVCLAPGWCGWLQPGAALPLRYTVIGCR